jgi:hypothetical protein
MIRQTFGRTGMTRPRIIGFKSALTVVIACSTVIAAAVAPQDNRQIGGVGIAVYENPNFTGRNATFRTDIPDLTSYGMNDRISSLRVARDELWELCEHANFRGRCQVFSGVESNLHAIQWNDIVTSLRRVRGDSDPGGGWGGPRAEVQLFEGVRFTGRRLDLNAGSEDLRRYGFSDRAMSLRLRGTRPWQICRDINFRNCVVVDSDVINLDDYDIGGLMSSLRPWSQGGGGAFPRPPSTGDRLVLYTNRNFGGQSYALERSLSSLQDFANRAQSARIVGYGVWELCDSSQFGGRCVTISSDVPDLGRLGMRNRVVSVRRRQ